MNQKHLAAYIAAYVQEELSRGCKPEHIDTAMIESAIAAFEGGADDLWFDASDDTYDEFGVNTKNSFNTAPKGAQA